MIDHKFLAGSLLRILHIAKHTMAEKVKIVSQNAA